jgi:hypothetical protein
MAPEQVIAQKLQKYQLKMERPGLSRAKKREYGLKMEHYRKQQGKQLQPGVDLRPGQFRRGRPGHSAVPFPQPIGILHINEECNDSTALT